jgi:hypothetical protein
MTAPALCRIELGIQLHSLIRQLDRHGIPQSADLKLLMRERMCG